MPQAAQVPDGLESGVDFPIVCEVCLGPNPYIRMIKQVNHKECKVSARVFNSFRWRPGSEARYKETVICPEVARAKGVCQCCLMDMEYNLPVGVRDALLKDGVEKEELPQTGVNQTYYYDQVAKASREDVEAGYGKMQSDKLMKMARGSPYYDRNLPKLCSFWLKGNCSRVVEGTCPYRPCCGTYRFPELASQFQDMNKTLKESLDEHGPVKCMRDKSQEMEAIKEQLKASQRGSRDQNIRDRYNGTDDLTNKYINKADSMELKAPEDKDVKTIWVGLMGLGATVSDKDLRDQFYAYGEVANINIVPQSNCAFVTYTDRAAAEQAVSKLHGNLVNFPMPLTHMARCIGRHHHPPSSSWLDDARVNSTSDIYPTHDAHRPHHAPFPLVGMLQIVNGTKLRISWGKSARKYGEDAGAGGGRGGSGGGRAYGGPPVPQVMMGGPPMGMMPPHGQQPAFPGGHLINPMFNVAPPGQAPPPGVIGRGAPLPPGKPAPPPGKPGGRGAPAPPPGRPGGKQPILYPSMDPNQMGTVAFPSTKPPPNPPTAAPTPSMPFRAFVYRMTIIRDQSAGDARDDLAGSY